MGLIPCFCQNVTFLCLNLVYFVNFVLFCLKSAIFVYMSYVLKRRIKCCNVIEILVVLKNFSENIVSLIYALGQDGRIFPSSQKLFKFQSIFRAAFIFAHTYFLSFIYSGGPIFSAPRSFIFFLQMYFSYFFHIYFTWKMKQYLS